VDIAYLPSSPLSVFAKLANVLIRLNVAVLFFVLMFFLPFQYCRKDVAAGRFITAYLALLTLFVCGLGSAVFNLPKNWYDAGYLYGLLLVILIFFLGEGFFEVFSRSVARRVFVYLGVVALLSQLVFIRRNLNSFLTGYVGPGVSIAKYDSSKTLDDLLAASRECKIDPVHSKRIVVDDSTYLYFQKSKWPMPITYIWFDKDDQAIRRFFSKVDSDGVVARCTSILPPYLSIAKKEGEFCCISRDELRSFVSSS
jgi:hypothetical protein